MYKRKKIDDGDEKMITIDKIVFMLKDGPMNNKELSLAIGVNHSTISKALVNCGYRREGYEIRKKGGRNGVFYLVELREES